MAINKYQELLQEYKPILKQQSTEAEYNKIISILELDYDVARMLIVPVLKDYYFTLDDYLEKHKKEIPIEYGTMLIENTKSNLTFVVEHIHKIQKWDFLYGEGGDLN